MYLKQVKDVLTLYGGLIILKVIMETKYQNLINYIQEQISDGQLGPGEKVPSENQLSEQFHISRQTVRKAIGTLEEDGLVQRIRGSGTYVSFDRRKNLEQRNSIAVVTTYVDSYIFPRILQGMQNTLFESGFSVQIYFTNNTLDREKSILKDLLKRDDVAGVIMEGTKSGLPNPNLDLYRHLMARKIPLLFFNTYYPELEAPHVSLNDAEAAYKAVRYLIDKGHQKIGAILKLDDGQGRQRYLGYLKAMEEAGLTVTDSRMVWIDTDESKQLGYCRDRILNRVEECTALLAYNDQIAFQLIRMLTERNIRVPEDVSVISIDDSDLARHSEVPITSLPHPKENLGKKAAETLLQMIAGRKKDLTYEFDTRVVERESVAECTENGNKKYTGYDREEILPEKYQLLAERACAKIKKVDTKKKQIELEWYGVENQKEAFLTEKLSFSGKNIEFDSKVEDYRAYREQEEKTGYTFAKADSEVLKEEDLRKIYDQEKLIGEVSPAYSIRIAINEIYARKGYDFTGTAYENYFSQKSWYAPVKGKIVQESEINQYEKENIDLLVKLEKNYK